MLGQHDALHAQEGLLLHIRVWVGHQVHDQLLATHARHDVAALGVELDELAQVVTAHSQRLWLRRRGPGTRGRGGGGCVSNCMCMGYVRVVLVRVVIT